MAHRGEFKNRTLYNFGGPTMTDPNQTLTPFELFIISGGNPANKLPAMCRIAADKSGPTVRLNRKADEAADLQAACGPSWAVLFLHKFHSSETPSCGLEPQFTNGGLDRLGEWAVIESLNEGSHQRAALPAGIDEALIGSGRWCAGDNGGHFQFLRDAVLAWCRLPSAAQWKFRDAARLLNIPRLVLSELAPIAQARREAARTARGLEALTTKAQAGYAAGDRLDAAESDIYAALEPEAAALIPIECHAAASLCEKYISNGCGRCPVQDFRFQEKPAAE
jgi:hypothetical protein